MRRVLVLFAHPSVEESRVNRQLLVRIPAADNVKFHDLYENYPDFNIDVEKEQKLLLDHDVIVWHHPLYWYSSPPILKQWIDLVLEYGWAYGTKGDKLEGKWVFNAITAGGGEDAYEPEGSNRFSITEFLRPFEQTGVLCNMEYLPPFVVHGTNDLDVKGLVMASTKYGQLLEAIGQDDFDFEKAKSLVYLNDIV